MTPDNDNFYMGETAVKTVATCTAAAVGSMLVLENYS